VALHREHAGRVVQLLGHVLADALHLATAGAGGGLGLVADLAPRQVGRQGCAFGDLLVLAACHWRRGLLDLIGHRLQVLIQRFIEQALLLGAEALRLCGELHALEQCVLVRELVDLRLLEDRLLALACDHAVSLGQLTHQRQQGRSHLLRLQGVKVVCGDHGRR
jgi:hypothetical protein